MTQHFDYINTYYHQEPLLDIMNPNEIWFDKCDFLISSDVFEHVPIPAQRAFDGSFKILNSGGILILTVPFGGNDETFEHYPDLKDYIISEISGEYFLVSRQAPGQFALFTDLIFHGGPGTTLEMRIFSRQSVIQHLIEAGFVDIVVHDETVPCWGIFPPHGFGLPITAKKP